MKEISAKFLAKADQSVEAADRLLADGYAEFAASRAYYAMFYAAEALLSERGRRFRKHSGVHAAFGEEFVKTGILDARFHRWLLDAFDKRLMSDYGVEEVLVHGARNNSSPKPRNSSWPRGGTSSVRGKSPCRNSAPAPPATQSASQARKQSTAT